MNNKNNALVQYFDLELVAKEDQEYFIDEIGGLVMDSILKKAWQQLEGTKKEALTELLEASNLDSENIEKSNAVLAFLDEHLVNLEAFVQKELAEIETAYKSTRDELSDKIV